MRVASLLACYIWKNRPAFGKNLRHMGKYGRGFENTEQMFGWENGLTQAWTVGNRNSKHIGSSSRVRRTNVRNICSGLFIKYREKINKKFTKGFQKINKVYLICS